MRRLSITILSLLLFIIGCAQNEAKNTGIQTGDNNYITVNQKNNSSNEQVTGEQVAEHLVKLTTRIPDVKDATAIVAGNYAVVGIDVDKDLDRTRVGSIKYSVAESLKDDPYGANAVVVADADTVERINQMREEIQNGRPIEGIVDELAGIVGRIMPQIPYNINSNEKPSEQNEKQIENDEKKQMDQIQKEQSQSNM